MVGKRSNYNNTNEESYDRRFLGRWCERWNLPLFWRYRGGVVVSEPACTSDDFLFLQQGRVLTALPAVLAQKLKARTLHAPTACRCYGTWIRPMCKAELSVNQSIDQSVMQSVCLSASNCEWQCMVMNKAIFKKTEDLFQRIISVLAKCKKKKKLNKSRTKSL